MAAVVAIGRSADVEGFALAGARVVAAETAAEVRAALAGPAAHAAVVVMTAPAWTAAGFAPGQPPVVPGQPLIVVMPP